MSEMIERVAQAIKAAGLVAMCGKNVQESVFVEAACAAIAAMREPTDAMKCAGHGVDGHHPDVVAIEWMAMIAEALGEVDE